MFSARLVFNDDEAAAEFDRQITIAIHLMENQHEEAGFVMVSSQKEGDKHVRLISTENLDFFARINEIAAA